jgi:hypothetical protein
MCYISLSLFLANQLPVAYKMQEVILTYFSLIYLKTINNVAALSAWGDSLSSDIQFGSFYTDIIKKMQFMC